MGYNTPPLVADATIANTGGLVTTVVVAAPGVGRRIRVVQVIASVFFNTAANCQIDIDGGAAPNLFRSSFGAVGTQRVEPWTLVEPGYQLGENQPLRAITNSSAAAGFCLVQVYYYIDDVS